MSINTNVTDFICYLGMSTLRAAGGSLACWGSSFVVEKIAQCTGRNITIGNFLNRITPIKIANFTGEVSTFLGKLPIWVQTKLWQNNYLKTWAFSKSFTCILAPFLEELVFRFGLQRGLTFTLSLIGANETIAVISSIALASILFAQAHENDFTTAHFSSVMNSGLIYGIMQEYANFWEAFLTHAFFNSSVYPITYITQLGPNVLSRCYNFFFS